MPKLLYEPCVTEKQHAGVHNPPCMPPGAPVTVCFSNISSRQVIVKHFSKQLGLCERSAPSHMDYHH